MKLFDSHCHLQDAALFQSAENVMERARFSGVGKMVCCGTRRTDWEMVFQLSTQFPQVIPMAGIHPWFVADDWQEQIRSLRNVLKVYTEAGIGETGLDFQKRFMNRAEQEASFAAHLDLAHELSRPVAVHCVHAWGRLIEILREHPAPRILLHAFGGAPELIPELVRLNCWFSFCGTVTNPDAKQVMASVIAVPVNRLLIETDSPDFPPSGCAAPNEPANLSRIAEAVAQQRKISVENTAALTFKNAEEFFISV